MSLSKKRKMAQDSSRELGKVFCDPIHGHVELHPLLVKIIDTPQFQRLRNIKQLGGAYLVYPGASHNRFEHSLGVAHLAGVLLKTLRENQPELEINDRDILCVQIAGLCHDLGHGPFSHLFDQMFMRACGNADWTHKMVSLKMFDYLVDNNGLKSVMENEYELQIRNDQGNEGEDLVFIKELILGEPLNVNNSSAEWPYRGRKVKKSFLYEIVSNKQNGIDVDTFDYFARDCHHTGIKNNFNHMRYFKFARVIAVEQDKSSRKHICLRDKEVENLYHLFHTRLLLHRRVCHHKVTTNVQIMITDALFSAKDHIDIEGADGTPPENVNTEAFTMLTDNITDEILKSTENTEGMEKAKGILKRIMTRKLYRFLGEAKLMPGQSRKIPKEKIEDPTNTPKQAHPENPENHKELMPGQSRKIPRKISTEKIEALTNKLKEAIPENPENHEDFFQVEIITFSYGKEEEDPMTYTYFYKKNEPDTAFTIPRNKVSDFLPDCFLEERIRVYWKNEEIDPIHVSNAFRDWCNSNGFEMVD